jgi:hypothetical protein
MFYYFSISQAAPGVWIKTATLGETLRKQGALTTRVANQQVLGSCGLQVLYGRCHATLYVMLRPTTAAAAAALPPTPGAAELAAAAAAVAAELALPFSTGLQALEPGMPPDLASALAALPPPGPGDASSNERTELRRGALIASRAPAELQEPGGSRDLSTWSLSTGPGRAAEIAALCAAVRMLRVRCSLPGKGGGQPLTQRPWAHPRSRGAIKLAELRLPHVTLRSSSPRYRPPPPAHAPAGGAGYLDP